MVSHRATSPLKKDLICTRLKICTGTNGPIKEEAYGYDAETQVCPKCLTAGERRKFQRSEAFSVFSQRNRFLFKLPVGRTSLEHIENSRKLADGESI
jgi:hypothetical protein